MSLWARSNQTDKDGKSTLERQQRVSFSSDPLRVLMRLEDRAIAELHPEDTPDEREERRLNLNERNYVRYFTQRNI